VTDKAEYQRQRRAKLRAMAEQTASPAEAAVARSMLEGPDMDAILREDPSLVNVPRRDNLRNAHSDGMVDYSTLIQNLSQAQRDAILERVNTKARPRA
jgi:TnpA family transposase